MSKKIMLLSVSALAVLALTACSVKESHLSGNTSTSEAKTEQSATKKTYAVGDKITFDGKAEYTVTAVEWTDERNQFDETHPEKVVKVTYNVTNLSDADMTVMGDIDLYVGGKKMETYPNGVTMDSLSPGRSYEGAVIYFGVNGSGAKELEIKPLLSLNTKAAVVSVDLAD